MIKIAQPLAGRAYAEKIHQAVKDQLSKGELVSGIKECQKTILRMEKSEETRDLLMVFNAQTSPMDLITHIPILCEERGIPYVFVENSEYLNGFTCALLNKNLQE